MLTAAVALASMTIAWFCARLIQKRGLAWGLADIPNDRSSHTSVVPKGAGFGIPLAAILATLLFAPSRTVFMGVSSLIAMAAFVNDKKELPVAGRLALQIAAAAILVYPVYLVARTYEGQSVLLFILVSMIFTVAQENIFNFMDGINGIAGLEAVISFVLLGIYAHLTGRPDLGLICAAVAAAAAGFLPLNFPKARVFMGDVASVFLGLAFAAIAVMLSRSLREMLALALFQGVFSVDGAMTIVRRITKKENIFLAHRQHLYQVLVHSRGWSHGKTTLVYGAVQACFGVLSLVFGPHSLFLTVGLWLGLVGIYWAGYRFAARPREGPEFRPAVTNA